MERMKFNKRVFGRERTLAQAVETALGIKLMATDPTDTVHGYINASGEDFEVFVYDTDEAPNAVHQTTLKAPDPTKKAALRGVIEAFK